MFEHIKNLGRFDNGLYWVSYNDHAPNGNIQEFLSQPNTNAFLIKGYDSDSFMLKLNNELGLGQPSIVDKPFTALREMLSEIVDIDDKEHFKGVKERLIISERQVEEAIRQFEFGTIEPHLNSETDLIKKEIIDLIVKEKYDEDKIVDIESRVKRAPSNEIQYLLSILYTNWGVSLGSEAKAKTSEVLEKLYQKSFEKYKRAITLNKDNHEAYYNWGTSLGYLAKTKKGEEAEIIYKESFKKFQNAVAIKQNVAAFINWGNFLENLASDKKGVEAQELLLQSIEKFKAAAELNPNHFEVFYNWGVVLGRLAGTKDEKEAQDLFYQSIEKFQKALSIKADDHQALYSLGMRFMQLAKTRKGIDAEVLYDKAFKQTKKAVDLGGKCYNLSCLYAGKGDKKSALFYLDTSLKKNEISVQFVEADDDWKGYSDDLDFKAILAKYRS